MTVRIKFDPISPISIVVIVMNKRKKGKNNSSSSTEVTTDQLSSSLLLHFLVPLKKKQAHTHENAVILESIIDDLRDIGDSDVILNEEEMALVFKIWGSVASATHFFVSAMAYEQRRYIIQHYKAFNRTHAHLFLILNNKLSSKSIYN